MWEPDRSLVHVWMTYSIWFDVKELTEGNDF